MIAILIKIIYPQKNYLNSNYEFIIIHLCYVWLTNKLTKKTWTNEKINKLLKRQYKKQNQNKLFLNTNLLNWFDNYHKRKSICLQNYQLFYYNHWMTNKLYKTSIGIPIGLEFIFNTMLNNVLNWMNSFKFFFLRYIYLLLSIWF